MSDDHEKANRLASALRANLARRKAQGRARQAAERAGEAETAGQGALAVPSVQEPARGAEAGVSSPAVAPEGDLAAPTSGKDRNAG